MCVCTIIDCMAIEIVFDSHITFSLYRKTLPSHYAGILSSRVRKDLLRSGRKDGESDTFMFTQ